ncbi:hypothetical protein B296_00016549 [Ensete ventricosum]|uniref:Uncharacterized protein n=1 Tax=Ensete ventricosum TaxID=4639 RepID=A0A426XRU8_ENSVE|nr:hypothetical protein B296_00016549 [Ensete ventricosum]
MATPPAGTTTYDQAPTGEASYDQGHLQGRLLTAKADANMRDRPRAWMAPAGVAPPSGTVLARKGGDYGHNARRSYRPRGSDARPPTGVAAPAAKGATRGQGGHWMRAEGES